MSDRNPLRKHFNRYIFLIHNNTNKYKSLHLLVNSDLFECIKFHEYDASIFATIKSKISELYLTTVLFYRENHVSPLNYTQYVQGIIASHNPSVVLGDFNDFFKEGVVSKCLSRLNFAQIVSEPTHIRGNLLDYIYLKDDLVNSSLFSSLVKSVYFLDHEHVVVLKTSQNL